MRALIVFASSHGSTAEVARFIADILRERGIESDIVAAAAAGSVENYDACLLGSAVHSGQWLPEMSYFVRRQRNSLSGKPIYLWLNCLRVTEPDGYAYVTNHYLPNILTGKLSFRKIGVFAGKVELDAIDKDEVWTLSFRYDGAKTPASLAGDYRDWNAIRAWAEQVAVNLNSGNV